MVKAGFGSNLAEIEQAVGELATAKLSVNKRALELKAQLNDRVSPADAAALNPGYPEPEGQTTEQRVQKLWNAVAEIAYHEGSFVPTDTLDVAHPDALK